MTPADRSGSATRPTQVIDDVISASGSDPTDHVEAIESIEYETVVDRRAGRLPIARHATTTAPTSSTSRRTSTSTDGQIDWLRIMCAGYQPVQHR